MTVGRGGRVDATMSTRPSLCFPYFFSIVPISMPYALARRFRRGGEHAPAEYRAMIRRPDRFIPPAWREVAFLAGCLVAGGLIRMVLV